MNNKGVGCRKDNLVGGVSVIYISRTNKLGVGVRRDNILHMILPERRDMLTYNEPCVCGSFTHVSTRNRDCMLNPKYMDALK